MISGEEHVYYETPDGTGYYLDRFFRYVLDNHLKKGMSHDLENNGVSPEEVTEMVRILKLVNLI